MFFHWLALHLELEGKNEQAAAYRGRRFYKLYPLHEYIEALVSASMSMYPDPDWGQAVRKHGPHIFRFWSGSGFGKSLLRGAATPWAVAYVAPHTYPVLCQPGEISIDQSDERMVIHFRNLWTLNEHLQLGLWQHLFESTGSAAEIEVESCGPAETRFHVRFLTPVSPPRSEGNYSVLVR